MKQFGIAIFIFTVSFEILPAVTTSVSFGNSTGTELRDNSGNLLSGGAAITQHDGAVVQIGYYALATTLDPFAGNWVAMTGPGTAYLNTIGDGGPGVAGRIKTTSIFSLGSLAFSEPSNTTPLAVRFYDSTSIATSTYFNAVSNTTGSWNWVTPTDPQPFIGLLLSDPGFVWQDGSASAFRTTIPIPEPSSSALLALHGLGALAVRRR